MARDRSRAESRAWLAGRRRQWCVLFGLLFLVISSWSLASPLFAYPDEAAHVIRAESVVRGQLLGHDESYRRGRQVSRVRAVQVPGILSNAGDTQPCYQLNPRQPANCAAPLQGPAHQVTQVTYVGTYPPLYYLVVGLPSLATPGTTGIYLMRLLSGALSAAFLATALVTVLGSLRPRAGALAFCAGVTPLAIYLASAVNPSGLEITSAMCLWASGLALARGPRHDQRLLTSQVGISSAVLVSMRGLSPLLLAVIVISILAVADRSTIRELAHRTAVRVWATVVAIVSALALAWIVWAGADRVAGYTYPGSSSTGYLIGQAVGSTWMWLKGLVGTVGLISSNSLIDLHADVPLFPLVAWLVTLCGLIVVAWHAGSRRKRLVLAALLTITFLLPIVLTVAEDRSVGPIWQSRYILPVSAGIAFLAASMISDRKTYARSWFDHAALVGLVLLGLGEIFMFIANLRRFMVGVAGPLNFFHGPWQPPISAVGLVMIGAVAELLLVGLLGALTTSRVRTTAPRPRLSRTRVSGR